MCSIVLCCWYNRSWLSEHEDRWLGKQASGLQVFIVECCTKAYCLVKANTAGMHRDGGLHCISVVINLLLLPSNV